MNFLKKIRLIKNENNQVLINESIVQEYERNNVEIKRETESLYEDAQDIEFHSLKLNKEKLERELVRLQDDNQRVYNGNLSLMEEINFLKYRLQETCTLLDEVVERYWNNDEKRKEYACLYPFERIEILSGGEVYTCCSGYVRHNFFIGNIYKDSFEEIWNSEEAKKLRYSVTKGNFEFCNNRCKWLHMDQNAIGGETATLNPIVKRNALEFDYKTFNDCVVQKFPKYITLTCDESCNLSCPSCRNNIKILSNEAKNLLYLKLMEVVRPLLPDCELLGALACGEFFASKALMEFYKTLTHSEFPKLKLYIITNAQLLTQKKWESLQNLHDIPIRFGVSIDASNKETYEKLRRGGKWETLCENMDYLSQIKNKRNSNVEFLCIHFVVQKENYLQMSEFVRLGVKWNVDTIEFQRMGNWGTFGADDYIQNDVFHPQNELYSEASALLRELIETTTDIKIVQNII